MSATKTEPGKFTTLAQYVEAMPADQKEIYYLIGDSRELIEHSPYVEAFTAKGQEVLLLTEPIGVHEKYNRRFARENGAALKQRGESVPKIGPSPGVRDLRWVKPVYVGDCVTYASEIRELRAVDNAYNLAQLLNRQRWILNHDML